MNLFQSKFHRAVVALILLIIIGVVGYMNLSNDSFVNALYMTVITITTVGFGEVHPLNEEEKLFTIFLIFMSLIIIGYAVSVLTEYIASDELFKNLKFKKVQKKIDKLKKHTIVCGYGRNGKQAVARLRSHGKLCVVIESDIELIKEIESERVLCVRGDATDDVTLQIAGIDHATSLITTLPSDANNLYVVLSARQLNKSCTIVSRASNDSSYSKLIIAGADNVIMPDKLGGAHMASLVVTPDIMEFIDRLSIEGESSTNLEEIIIENLPKEYHSRSILDLDLRRKTGCTVIGFKKPDKEYVINPEATTILTPNSKLIVLGKPEQIEKLHQFF